MNSTSVHSRPLPTRTNPAAAFLLLALLAACSFQVEPDTATVTTQPSIQFEKVVLDTTFRSEGVAVGDVNQDGNLDIMAGEVWYEAPGWQMHEVTEPGNYDGATGYSRAFYNFAHDMNGDGWVDLVGGTMQDKPFWWYENSRGKPGHWKEHTSDRTNWGEAPRLTDLFQNGSFVMASQMNGSGHVYWASLPPNGESAWPTHIISGPEEPGQKKFRHGLGIGDINRDGRDDIVGNQGWWETPANPTQSPWAFHPFLETPEPCANIEVVDLDADGDPDLVTSAGHKTGVWWFEHRPIEGGDPLFECHLIDDSFTQSHSIRVADLDGDGDYDIVTGKRFWAHNKTDTDPGTNSPAVLYWYENHQGPDGTLAFKRHLIDDDSGVGLQFLITDMNADNKPDIVISNKKGVHLFLQNSGT